MEAARKRLGIRDEEIRACVDYDLAKAREERPSLRESACMRLEQEDKNLQLRRRLIKLGKELWIKGRRNFRVGAQL